MTEHACVVCQRVNEYTRNYDTFRCKRCGAVYSLLPAGEPSRISPDMEPVNVRGMRSPWMPDTTRPIWPGPYECRFRSLDGYLTLFWDTRCFRHNGHRVQVRDLKAWRGVWASDH